MEMEFQPKEINVYAITPYAVIPAMYKIRDKKVFGVLGRYAYSLNVLATTFPIHHILAYTKLSSSEVEQINRELQNKTWKQIILDFYESIFHVAPLLDILTSIKERKQFIANISYYVQNRLISRLTQKTNCPIMHKLIGKVLTLLPLSFLHYRLDYNQFMQIEDDNSLKSLARSIVLDTKHSISRVIATKYADLPTRFIPFVSSMPINVFDSVKTAIDYPYSVQWTLNRNYYPVRNWIVQTLMLDRNNFHQPEHMVVIVEYKYSKAQMTKIVSLFETFFTFLAIIDHIRQHLRSEVLALLQYLYLHFAIPYYSGIGRKDTDEISVIWLFDYYKFAILYGGLVSKISHKLGHSLDDLIKGKDPASNTLKQMSIFLPTHVVPHIIKSILDELKTAAHKLIEDLNSFVDIPDYTYRIRLPGPIEAYLLIDALNKLTSLDSGFDKVHTLLDLDQDVRITFEIAIRKLMYQPEALISTLEIGRLLNDPWLATVLKEYGFDGLTYVGRVSFDGWDKSVLIGLRCGLLGEFRKYEFDANFESFEISGLSLLDINPSTTAQYTLRRDFAFEELGIPFSYVQDIARRYNRFQPIIEFTGKNGNDIVLDMFVVK